MGECQSRLGRLSPVLLRKTCVKKFVLMLAPGSYMDIKFFEHEVQSANVPVKSDV